MNQLYKHYLWNYCHNHKYDIHQNHNNSICTKERRLVQVLTISHATMRIWHKTCKFQSLSDCGRRNCCSWVQIKRAYAHGKAYGGTRYEPIAWNVDWVCRIMTWSRHSMWQPKIARNLKSSRKWITWIGISTLEPLSEQSRTELHERFSRVRWQAGRQVDEWLGYGDPAP